jgi:outer membrane lipoprotein-sorting protein
VSRPSKTPIENLRPQHILDALFWPEVTAKEPVLFEEVNLPPARFYVLTLLRRSDSGLEISRKIWFDRADLHISRIEIYGPGGKIDSDIAYSMWEADSVAAAGPGAAAGGSPAPAGPPFPHEIHITRPQDDYQLALSINKLTLNSDIPAGRFALPQPPGTELVRVGENEPGAQP